MNFFFLTNGIYQIVSVQSRSIIYKALVINSYFKVLAFGFIFF